VGSVSTEQVRVLGVGTVALDSVQTPGGSVDDVPGGSALYFGAAARHFASVALAGVIGEDFPEETLRTFSGLGVDVSAIQRHPGESFRWKVRYGADLTERETLESNRGVTLQGGLSIPAEHRRPEAVFLGSTHPAVQRAALEEVESGLVVLDTMTHWIEDRREELVELLARVDVLLVNQEEAKLLSERGAPPLAAAVLRAMGPQWVVIKRGPAGAMAFGPSVDVAVPARPMDSTVDPTGAGDAFAGGFVGALAGSATVDASSVRRALGAGVVMGALAVSSFSLDSLVEVDGAEVAKRLGA
jgi:sugar/nucleoside kinase (ribokinase family)